MKFLLFLTAALIILAGCSASHTSHTEDCTLNGQKVDCSQMKNSQTETRKTEASAVQLTSRGRYKIKNGQLVVLTDIKNERSVVIGGVNYTCAIDMKKNVPYDFRVNERELALVSEGQEVLFERMGQDVDYGNLMIGKFRNDSEDKKKIMVLEFISVDVLEATALCSFN